MSDDEIQALYQSAQSSEPGPALDRRILDAAHANLAGQSSARPKAQPWWKKWLPAGSAIAATVIGLSVTLRVYEERNRQDNEIDAETVTPVESGVAAPGPEAKSAAAKKQLDQNGVRKGKATVSKPSAAASLAPQATPSSVTPATAIPAQLAAPGAAQDAALRKSIPIRTNPMLQNAPTEKLQTERVEQMPAANTGSGASDAAMRSAPVMLPATPGAAGIMGGPSEPAPEAWLARIRELLAAGRRAEALESAARFRDAYPAYPLPDDLSTLK